ncbi:MAG TPA: sodium-translocating pyrophosphatase [Spirochaetota bacterium]|nr:sodium-translocating pyrophosphatase [Spirochaetota bacterium]HOS31718.1 sodium-translocating pyrophosphatase [Spirochaetota bacterium]HOS54947.1 sodium-translocating pyrophosphatase [Spirochaetota bacterium]HPK62762.1 sodium-translocating pyrophosphatase [Spirochaetota bacterium]HQF78807.1 sodium-translocating pyrophosphatase [Spirochaetota bacterium]
MFLNALGSFIALIFALILAVGILKKSPGTERMQEISKYIQEGAMAYLKQQYKIVGLFFILLFIILGFIAWILPLFVGGKPWLSGFVPFAFITGGFFSGLSGFIGMKVATKANCRTAQAASESLNSGLRVAFNSGTVMGMVVVGLGLLDISLWWILLRYVFMPLGIGIETIDEIPPIMITFGMGASSMALFARLGGGIYTKAADVGADLVGKVEAGIPEDDPRNPATIADNVGDNVGDVAGMGADLYESYVGSIIATMALGSIAALSLAGNEGDILKYIQLPAIIGVVGVVCSIIGTFFVKAKDDASQKTLLAALRAGVYSSTVLIAIASFFIVWGLLGLKALGLWAAIMAGLVAGNVIGYFTEYFTSDNYRPTQNLAKTSLTGPATIIIGGLSLGMMSTAIPVITVVISMVCSYYFVGGGMMGLYGIGLAAVGMLSTLGITLATDAYGPVADNAGGIAEMAGLPAEVRKRTDALDSLGNTTAATGKGFAIGSAALTALALLAEYGNKIFEFKSLLPANSALISGNEILANILNPMILIGIFFGAVLPFVFSSMSMGAVGRAAQSMVEEVRRQFKEKPGIMDGKDKPDYARCVQISTIGAQKEMLVPSLLAIFSPIIIGIVFGPGTVLGLLAGATCSGFVLAVMMANAGGAWDNAKKYIEGGQFGGKKSDAHKAAVVGDTVGDPFKDTSGPCINILIKLMSMVSIVFVGTCIGLNTAIIKFLENLFR